MKKGFAALILCICLCLTSVLMWAIVKTSRISSKEVQSDGAEGLSGSAKEMELGIVSLVAATADSEKITVTWINVSGAEGYLVYRKTENTSWTRIAKLSGSSTNSYDDSDIASETTYTYTVRAYKTENGKEIIGGYDTKGVSVTTQEVEFGTVKLIAATASSEKITVTWAGMSGAEGYLVYRKTENTGWTRIGKLGGSTSNSYEDNEVVSGTTYSYTVRAYRTEDEKETLGGYDATGVSAMAE